MLYCEICARPGHTEAQVQYNRVESNGGVYLHGRKWRLQVGYLFITAIDTKQKHLVLQVSYMTRLDMFYEYYYYVVIMHIDVYVWQIKKLLLWFIMLHYNFHNSVNKYY